MDDSSLNANTNLDIDQQSENDQNKMAKENLKAVLQVGLTIQMISVVIAFAIKKGKTDFLTKLNQIILEMSNALTEEEKKELQEDTDTMIAQKADEMIKLMGENMSPEEIVQAISELKDIIVQQAGMANQ